MSTTAGLTFFLDRSLGRHRLARALRASGLDVHPLAEIYGVPADERIADVDWLPLAGENDWVVLMKDSRIRYRTVEREALVANGVRAFCLASGNLRADEMAAAVVTRLDAIVEQCARPGPFLVSVSTTHLREVPLR